MAQSLELKQPSRHWYAAFVGAVIACVAMNALVVGYRIGTQGGQFVSWTALPAPPSAVERIIEADFHEIWVQAQDGQIYYTDTINPAHRLVWEPARDVSRSTGYPESSRGTDCEAIRTGVFPRNPNGQTIECIRADEDSYFALLADGWLAYWRNGVLVLDSVIQFLHLIASTVCPFLVAVLILVFSLHKRAPEPVG